MLMNPAETKMPQLAPVIIWKSLSSQMKFTLLHAFFTFKTRANQKQKRLVASFVGYCRSFKRTKDMVSGSFTKRKHFFLFYPQLSKKFLFFSGCKWHPLTNLEISKLDVLDANSFKFFYLMSHLFDHTTNLTITSFLQNNREGS